MKQTDMRNSPRVSIFHSLSEKGSAFLLLFSCVALTVMVLIVAYDVLLRNFFGSALNGVSEYVSEWLMPATILFALAYTEHKNEHIRVTLVEDSIGPGPQKVLRLVAQLIVVAIAVVLAWSSLQLAIDSFGIHETVPMGTDLLPVWPIKIAVFFGWLWLTIQTFSKFVGILIERPQIEPASDPSATIQGKSVGGSDD